MNDPRLPFDVKFRLSDKELVLSYDVRNASERDVYLINRVFREDPFQMSPDVIYIHLERDEKTVWLNKQTPAQPPKKPGESDPYMLIVPADTPLRAGSAFHEDVHVPLPVNEFRAYGGPPKNPKIMRYKMVRFTLEYYWRTEGMVEEAQDFNGVQIVVTRGGVPLRQSDFGLLESKIVLLDIPVLEGSE